MPRLLCLAILVVLPLACSRGPAQYAISGTVTYDGKAVNAGDISFISTEHPEWGPDGVVIKDGVYSLMVKAGSARVVITGNRPITDSEILKKAGGVPPREDYIPAKHNSDSAATVVISGPNSRLNFDLAK